MRWVNEERLADTLAYVRGSPHSQFYAKKYGTLPVDETHFFNLPLLERVELVSVPLSERLYVPKGDVRFIAFTSGTTSKAPLLIPFCDIERYYFEPSLGTGVVRPLIIHPPLLKSFSHTFLQQCRQATQPVSPVFGDVQNLENSALLAAELECDSIYTLPTIAALFAEPLNRRGAAERIRLLTVSSEMFTEARRTELEKAYPNALIANLYGSAELGQLLFFPCRRIMESGFNYFHILTQAIAALELVEGELVISYGLNRAAPLLRYRTGDYFYEVSEGCPCGLPGPVLAWAYRKDVDRARLNGMEFDAEAADRAFAVFPQLAKAPYQIHFRPVSGSSAIALEVEIVATGPHAEDLARFAQAELPDVWRLTSTATVRTALERGLVASFSVKPVPALSGGGVKARRFVNHVV